MPPIRKKFKAAEVPNQKKITSFLPVPTVTKPTSPQPPPLPDSQVKRKFQQVWLTTYRPWLLFDKEKNCMYCQLCQNSGMTNTMATGTDNFRTSTITRHVACSDHKLATAAPKERENMSSAVNKVLNRQEKGVMVALKAVYWMAQVGLPLSKYSSVMNFLKEVETPNVDALVLNSRVDYTSYNTSVDLLTALSTVIDNSITEKLEKSPAISILTDESTDIIVHHKLCITARVVDPRTLLPSTHFLADTRLASGTGKGIFDEIKSHLEKRNIPISKIMGLGTDGANTMTGTKEGLTGQFLKENPHLVNTHCAAHRLALCTEQSAKSVPAMVEFQRTTEQIYYHFKKSPVKCDRLSEIQKLLDEPKLKYREVHQIRWLSFYEAIDAIHRTLGSLITYLVSSTDPAAAGIKKAVATEMYISLTYAMMDILQPIMKLCLIFQKKDLDIGIVQVSLEECVRSLKDIRDDHNPLEKPTYLEKLKKDLSNGMFKEHQVAKLKKTTQFTNAKNQFIDAVLQNLAKRFPDTQLLTSLAVLALRPISFLGDDELQEWGNESIKSLAAFYGREQVHNYVDPGTKEKAVAKSAPVISATDLPAEWQKLKAVVKAQQYPRASMASLWQLIAEYHRDEFPNLLQLAALALTHPVHTADCERAFSSQNQVTTSLRNRLSPDNCDKLMRIMIEGPKDMKDFDFTAAVIEWRKQKPRVIFN